MNGMRSGKPEAVMKSRSYKMIIAVCLAASLIAPIVSRAD
jgi:hypothetical protein